MDLFLPWWTCNSEKLNCVVCMVVCCSVHHGLNALWEEEAVVEGVHGVVGLHHTIPLEQYGPCVQTVIRPEDGEAGFFITMDQGPG